MIKYIIKKKLILLFLFCLLFVAYSLLPSIPEQSLITKARESSIRFQHKLANNQLFILVNFDLPVFRKRLWIIDRASGKIILNAHVSHAWKSGILFASKFSNIPETGLSTTGAFVTGEDYQGRFGYSMRVDGLEPGINDKTRSRSIVFHPGYYLWSYGCFITTPQNMREIIELTKKGTFLYVHASS